MFLLNDQRNKNGWRATWESILLRAKEFITFPGIVYYACDQDGCRLDHTGGKNYDDPKKTYNELLKNQKPHIVSTTIDVQIDELTHTAYSIDKITSKYFAEKVKDKDHIYVSPSMMIRDNKYDFVGFQDGKRFIDIHDWLPVHHAFVNEPAFDQVAHVSHTCEGPESKCLNTLRNVTASVKPKCIKNDVKRLEIRDRLNKINSELIL